MTLPLIKIENLSVEYAQKNFLFKKKYSKMAVYDVSLTIPKGKTVGILGESGSGKTSLGKALVRLVPILKGNIYYQDTNISKLNSKDFLFYRKKIQMIFQDPYTSLNPSLSIYQIISEPLDLHFKLGNKKDRIAQLLEQVGLSPEYMHRYPNELSGGQRQRIGIARALAVEPELIICDEPVSALDVSIQAQIINLLQDLQEKLGIAYLFIGHDLAVVRHISDFIVVMKEGKIIERNFSDSLIENPQDPYTQMLVKMARKNI